MDLKFGDKGTEDIFYGRKTKESNKIMPVQLHAIARKKIDQMLWVKTLHDLRIPPGNRLERLKGDRKDFYSIRINNQYRIIFRNEGGRFVEVSIVDYH